jgi:hypothetical protein
MKTKLKISLSLLFLWLAIGGCEPSFDSEKCEGENTLLVESYFSKEINEFPCGLTNLDEKAKQINLIIETKSDFEKYFSCNEGFPDIDFNKYFILAGRYTHKNCAVLINQNVVICENTLVYNVNIQAQICNGISDVYYYQIVLRDYLKYKIKFNVQLLD